MARARCYPALVLFEGSLDLAVLPPDADRLSSNLACITLANGPVKSSDRYLFLDKLNYSLDIRLVLALLGLTPTSE